MKGRTKQSGRTPTIGFLCAHGGYGGTEMYLNKLIRPTAASGYRVVFFHPAESPADWVARIRHYARIVPYDGAVSAVPAASATQRPGSVRQGGGRVRRVARRLYRGIAPKSVRFLVWFAKETWRLRALFAQTRVDVLHASDLGVDPWIVAARLAGIPRLTGALGCLPRTDPFGCSCTHRLLEMLCFACMDEIAAVSENGRKRWLNRARINPHKVRVVHNGAGFASLDHAERTAQDVRRELGISPDARVVGVTAGLIPIKGHAFLLTGFPRVLEALPNTRLVFAGDGPIRRDLEDLARRLKLTDRVQFLGHRKDIMRIILAYDVIALPSVTESLPFSLLEGMSCGKPVVATAVGGVPELVEHGVTGYVVVPRNPDALAEALIDVLSDPEKLDRMGRAALERVRTEFSAEKMLRETLDVILAGRRAHTDVTVNAGGESHG